MRYYPPNESPFSIEVVISKAAFRDQEMTGKGIGVCAAGPDFRMAMIHATIAGWRRM